MILAGFLEYHLANYCFLNESLKIYLQADPIAVPVAFRKNVEGLK